MKHNNLISWDNLAKDYDLPISHEELTVCSSWPMIPSIFLETLMLIPIDTSILDGKMVPSLLVLKIKIYTNSSFMMPLSVSILTPFGIATPALLISRKPLINYGNSPSYLRSNA